MAPGPLWQTWNRSRYFQTTNWQYNRLSFDLENHNNFTHNSGRHESQFGPTEINLKKRKENGNMAFRCNKRITIVSAGLHQNPYNFTNKVNIFQHDTYISPFPISTNDRGYCIQILITCSSNDNNNLLYNNVVFHMNITDCNIPKLSKNCPG